VISATLAANGCPVKAQAIHASAGATVGPDARWRSFLLPGGGLPSERMSAMDGDLIRAVLPWVIQLRVEPKRNRVGPKLRGRRVMKPSRLPLG
jgi:uncharacterized protein YijF (DUF1287 family)